jgi:hypothetical protein
MTTFATNLSSTAFWGRERKSHQARRFEAFLREVHPSGMPDLDQYGVAKFYGELYSWHEAKGFKQIDYPSDRQLRRIRKLYLGADMSAGPAP